MEALEHNIESEKLLVELLGYTLEGPDENNKWIILDEVGNPVGYIKYKKFNNGDKENGFTPVYGYRMTIDSDKVFYKDNRAKDHKGFSYDFDIKRKEPVHVALNLGDYAGISIWDNMYKNYWNFRVNNRELCLDFNDETENFETMETVTCKNWGIPNYMREYTYKISAYDKRDRQPMPNFEHRITGHQMFENRVVIDEMTLKNNVVTKSKISFAQGTVEELGSMNDMGIDAFNRFRFLINQTLPFTKDIIPLILTEGRVKRYKYQAFMPKEEKAAVKQKTNDNTTANTTGNE